MRCMLKLEIDTDAGNRAISEGALPKIMQQVMDKTKPTAFIFFDLADPSDIPAIAEPAFSHLGARVTFTPVMNSDDLQKGLAQLG